MPFQFFSVCWCSVSLLDTLVPLCSLLMHVCIFAGGSDLLLLSACCVHPHSDSFSHRTFPLDITLTGVCLEMKCVQNISGALSFSTDPIKRLHCYFMDAAGMQTEKLSQLSFLKSFFDRFLYDFCQICWDMKMYHEIYESTCASAKKFINVLLRFIFIYYILVLMEIRKHMRTVIPSLSKESSGNSFFFFKSTF